MYSSKGGIPWDASFRRKPESSYFKAFWTPAFAGVTVLGAFYDFINIIYPPFLRKSASR
jgi:hypothetical protein